MDAERRRDEEERQEIEANYNRYYLSILAVNGWMKAHPALGEEKLRDLQIQIENLQKELSLWQDQSSESQKG